MSKQISSIDVEQGRLHFRGQDATILAQQRSYESVLHLLVEGRLPTAAQLRTVREEMHRVREMRGNHAVTLGANAATGTDGLKALAASLGGEDPQLYDTLLSFVTLAPIVVCASWRVKKGLSPISPSPELGHAANILLMMDIKPREGIERQFETCLILHMDDPDNPSLSALRDAMTNRRSCSEALQLALDEHAKPLHHAAGTEAYKMLLELTKTGNVSAELQRRIEKGERIFGLGHRIYMTIDPRAVVLRRLLRERAPGMGLDWLLEAAETVAQEGADLLGRSKGKDFFPNVDLYNAAVYTTFGLPFEFNTDLFAISRVAGWMAHVLEMNTACQLPR